MYKVYKATVLSLLLGYLFLTTSIHSQDTQDLSNQMNSALDGIKSFPEQFAMGFGYCPSDYTYSMSVWNDFNQPVYAELQSVVSVQGAKFNSTTAASQTIRPYSSSTKGTFDNVHVCHAIVRLQALNHQIFRRGIDIDKSDKKMYYYHAFGISGSPDGEFMGPGFYGGPYTQTSEFDGVFFNNTPYDVSLSFTYVANNKPVNYTLTLEAGSFNLLSSDSTQPYSIRDVAKTRSFSFGLPNKTKTSLPIYPLGLGQIYWDATSSTSISLPLTYTYEVYGTNKSALQVGIQGFNMGNHNQVGIPAVNPQTPPKNLAPIRDINPIMCSVWCQSPEQYTASMPSGSADKQTFAYATKEHVWAAYSTQDYSLFQELVPGKVTSFSLVRPTTHESSARLYIFALDSDNPDRSRSFLQRVLANPSGITKALAVDIPNPATATTQEIAQAVAQALNMPAHESITDAVTGVTGTLLLSDILLSYGGRQQRSRFYEILPPLVSLNSLFASTVVSQLDLSKFQSAGSTQSAALAAATNEFMQNIRGWLKAFTDNYKPTSFTGITITNVQRYQAQLESLVPELTSYLKTKGMQTLFTNPKAASAERQLNTQGVQSLYLILFGPVSLKNPPLLRQAGTNTYLQGTKPKNWPGV